LSEWSVSLFDEAFGAIADVHDLRFEQIGAEYFDVIFDRRCSLPNDDDALLFTTSYGLSLYYSYLKYSMI
jgi:hypothetical protein